MTNNNIKKTILLDLDGVLNEYCGEYKEFHIPPLKEGARKFLELLHNEFKIVIFSTRDSLLVKKWIKSNKLDEYIDCVTDKKLPAFVQIDDRCINFKGDYTQTIEQIKSFKPHWKR